MIERVEMKTGVQRLRWAVDFAAEDLAQLRPGDWLNLRQEIWLFICAAQNGSAPAVAVSRAELAFIAMPETFPLQATDAESPQSRPRPAISSSRPNPMHRSIPPGTSSCLLAGPSSDRWDSSTHSARGATSSSPASSSSSHERGRAGSAAAPLRHLAGASSGRQGGGSTAASDARAARPSRPGRRRRRGERDRSARSRPLERPERSTRSTRRPSPGFARKRGPHDERRRLRLPAGVALVGWFPGRGPARARGREASRPARRATPGEGRGRGETVPQGPGPRGPRWSLPRPAGRARVGRRTPRRRGRPRDCEGPAVGEEDEEPREAAPRLLRAHAGGRRDAGHAGPIPDAAAEGGPGRPRPSVANSSSCATPTVSRFGRRASRQAASRTSSSSRSTTFARAFSRPTRSRPC